MLETIWNVKPADVQAVSQLAYDMRLPRTVANVLVVRGLDTADKVAKFCAVGVQQLHNPFDLPDIQPVLERLHRAIDNKEHIYVHGDYDVDGVTATAVVCHSLKLLGADFEVHVPHRINDGYDMRPKTVDKAIEAKAKLMMTVDCGIVAFEAATYAKEHGIDLIITDHHTPSADGRVPHAVGVVNPSRLDSTYPFPGLAGVGIAFKVMVALAHQRGVSARQMMNELLEYVALGTVADVAPMIDENRTLVHMGCEMLTKSHKPGVSELLKIAGVKNVSTTSIGFFLGPRINAIGRLADSDVALKLMLEQNSSRASYLAHQLNAANEKRQDMQEQMVKEALALLPEDLSETYIITLGVRGWHPGLVGLVAGKVAEQTGRPTLACTINDEGMAKGSCRSYADFHILNALKSEGVWDLFARREDGSVVCGGHSFAAGFSLPEENLPLFAQRLNAYGKKMMVGVTPQKVVEIDARITPAEISVLTYNHLIKIAPFGSGNPEPIFLAEDMVVTECKTVGAGGKHLKLRLKGPRPTDNSVDAIAWRRGDEAETYHEGVHLDAAFKLSLEEFRGRISLTMTIEDLRPVV